MPFMCILSRLKAENRRLHDSERTYLLDNLNVKKGSNNLRNQSPFRIKRVELYLKFNKISESKTYELIMKQDSAKNEHFLYLKTELKLHLLSVDMIYIRKTLQNSNYY